MQTCPGDCDGDGMVTIDELLLMVRIAALEAGISVCPAGDVDANGVITIDEIVRAVNVALSGCEAVP